MSNLCEANRFGRNRNGLSITTLYVTSPYVRSLEEKLKRDEVLSHFSAFGNVKSVRIRNKPTHSFGLVKFTQAKSATNALQTKFHTIAGRRVKITVAYNRHQDKKINTTLLDLNNDCILEILSNKCLSAIDLCSVAETCMRFKEIARQAFRREHKVCNINLQSHDVIRSTERILIHFGSEISDLKICGKSHFGKEWTSVLDFAAKYCSNTLESLYLDGGDISENFTARLRPIFNNLKKLRIKGCTFEGASKTLFSDCRSLVELDICTEGSTFIIENTFPKLLRFKCDTYPYNQCNLTDYNLESFLSRHAKLNSLRIWNKNKESDLLPLIADNCKSLEELKCRIPLYASYDLSNLVSLRILNIGNRYSDVTKTARGLNSLVLLESLKLVRTKVDSEFIRALSQLKMLQILRLKGCTELQNLHQIDNLHQLKELKIDSLEYVNLDIVLLIKRLINLTYLSIAVSRFEIDLETYLLIVDVVRNRPEKSKLILRLYGHPNILCDFTQTSHIVQMIIR